MQKILLQEQIVSAISVAKPCALAKRSCKVVARTSPAVHSGIMGINGLVQSATFKYYYAAGLHGTGGGCLYRLISRFDNIQRGLPGGINGQVPATLGNPW